MRNETVKRLIRKESRKSSPPRRSVLTDRDTETVRHFVCGTSYQVCVRVSAGSFFIALLALPVNAVLVSLSSS